MNSPPNCRRVWPSSRKQPPEVLFSLATTSRERPLNLMCALAGGLTVKQNTVNFEFFWKLTKEFTAK